MSDTIESIADEMLCECDPISPELVHEYARRLAAAPRSEWLPISEAPKDGTYIIGAMPYGTKWACRQMLWQDAQDAWIGASDDHVHNPTHFMPLPPPPSVERS